MTSDLPRVDTGRMVGLGSSTIVGHRASVISGDQNGKGREVERQVNDGGEDEVLEVDGGAMDRPGHVFRTMVAHGSLQ
jgi:hypothetical protein